MNRHVLGALFEDAFRQVLDDKVFRLLVILALVMIVPTFLVGFRPEGVSLLWGVKTWTYEELLRSFGGGGARVGDDTSIRVIGEIQRVIVQGLVGSVGLLFCIAATAFFVPRMLEKGAADTLFSKPVGRFALLIARYVAGVLFVACLSFVLVPGMHLGFLVTSGYSDPAFLWSALTLTYVFALVHSVSVAVAVFTRSSIAAILTTLIFFTFTGCIQQSWIGLEHRDAIDADSRSRGDADAGADSGPGFLRKTLNVLHWTLPKTSDADYVVASLRRAATESPAELSDSNGLVSVVATPKSWERDGAKGTDLAAAPAAWVRRDADGAEIGRVTLARSGRADPERAGKLRVPSSFASELAKALEKADAAGEKPDRGGSPEPKGLDVSWVRWRDRGVGPTSELAHARGFMAVEDALYTLDATFTAAFGGADERDDALEAFTDEIRVDKKRAANLPKEEWYSRAFGFSAPWRYNALVSIVTSLVFAVVLLALARWKLARIDF